MRQWGEYWEVEGHEVPKHVIDFAKERLLDDFEKWPIPEYENIIYAEWIIRERWIKGIEGLVPVTSVALKITTDGDGNVV